MKVLMIHSCPFHLFNQSMVYTLKHFGCKKVDILCSPRSKTVFESMAEVGKIYSYSTDYLYVNPFREQVVFEQIKNHNYNAVVLTYNNNNGHGYENLRVIAHKLGCEQTIHLSADLEQLDNNLFIYDNDLENTRFRCALSEEGVDWLRLASTKRWAQPLDRDNNRIVIITESFRVGGLERYVVELAIGLRNKGWNLAVLAVYGGPFQSVLQENHVPVYCSHPLVETGPIGYQETLFMESRLEHLQPQMTIITGHSVLLPATLAALRAGVPRIVRSENVDLPLPSLYAQDFQLAMPYIDSFICVSHSVANSIAPFLPPGDTRVRVVLGSSVRGELYLRENSQAYLQQIQQIQDSLGLRDGTKVIFTAARLSAEKGLEYLLHAVPRVVAKDPQVTFLLAGDGPLRRQLEELAFSLGIQRFVRFLGPRLDIPILLNMSLFSCLPSLREGLPLFIIESFFAAKPVVATAVSGVPEIVRHGETGLLVPPADSRALAEAIIAMLKDEAGRNEMGRRARENAIHHLGIEQLVDSVDRELRLLSN
ncbi:Alpha-D-kanosaminyltransferase [Moorella thermoacetica]|uniref:Alpha-D-kanosaminyltransferase n=2 Tax=Neomoorella thermoacetica TaxID=1525 RepID=A0AAC9HG83_NEOTH|nr:Alpha-D-kanosaminyltransferase [Moorella thermoacetica]